MVYKNNISRTRRIILGCRAMGGENISRLATEFDTSRQFIYSQKEKIQHILEQDFDLPLAQTPTLTITKEFIQKVIFCCMVICKGSIEDTQECIQSLFQIHISIGSISKIINELAQKAKTFNDSVCLEAIKVGAHDEIFQSDQAVLVGVEPNSTSIYLCDGSQIRDSTAWGCSLLDKQAQGLNIELSVNDGGTGLIKGIQEVYPAAKIQSDIFHAEKKFSEPMYRAERSAYKAIAKELDKDQARRFYNDLKAWDELEIARDCYLKGYTRTKIPEKCTGTTEVYLARLLANLLENKAKDQVLASLKDKGFSHVETVVRRLYTDMDLEDHSKETFIKTKNLLRFNSFWEYWHILNAHLADE